ncbi:hypothetical protein [Paenibacillus typhae]|uniref:Uncharacterized protein n=1 Tax=Paenibacillus typhae TaxID=1174501 RepID=A0A1G8Q7T9_9BACL|nr:hypothetical protein [Paenibacillus typhae]MBY0010761.1 hypothetical protein [Paenibacillus typhae]SDJ00626.1 hypothetical protein SAMN05216192_110183 [Paenibacillus typhae]
MDTTELRIFVDENKPFEVAKESFWNWIYTWKGEDPEDYFELFRNEDITTIVLTNERIALVINYQFDNPVEFLQTTINVYFKESLIAKYHYMQDFDGKAIDDVLSFEKYSILTENL